MHENNPRLFKSTREARKKPSFAVGSGRHGGEAHNNQARFWGKTPEDSPFEVGERVIDKETGEIGKIRCIFPDVEKCLEGVPEDFLLFSVDFGNQFRVLRVEEIRAENP